MSVTFKIWQDDYGTWRFVVNHLEPEGTSMLEAGTAESEKGCQEMVDSVILETVLGVSL